MKTLKDQVREIIIEYILLEYKEYEWFESGEHFFALAVKLHGKLQGVDWGIKNVHNRPQVQLSLSVLDANPLGESKYISVDIDKWKLIDKKMRCWNQHKDARGFRAINPKEKK